ncbi:MAG: helix-turn-helix transcriptional regulator [Clostridiales bacterium]|nr:helix-turn-helix transcriptional regulator [Clostridiales bacterium]
MNYSDIVVKRITSLCKQRGISYNKLATMCGVSQSTIDNIIRGISKNPRIQTLHRIAIGLNMTLAEFLDFEELNEYSFDD